jgi:hypothetical protein
MFSGFGVQEPEKIQKLRQIFSTVKFAKKNSRFLPFLGGFYMKGTLRM